MAHRGRVAGRQAVFAVLITLAFVAGGPVSIARADGDPASDYLLANQVFVTSASGSLSPSQRQLLKTVEGANRAGFKIRVAVIATSLDLGSVTQLWGQPRAYARFLGVELSLAYKQRLLVVMPNGFGFNWPGHSGASEYRLLAKEVIKPGRAGLALAAAAAVRRLAAAAHITPVAVSKLAPAGSTNSTLVVIVVTGVVCVLIALALVLWRARRRQRRRQRVVVRRPLSLRAHLAIASSMVICALLAAAAVIVVNSAPVASRGASATASDPAARARARSVVLPPPVRWPAGQRRAPNFLLQDQSGGPVSIAEYRGHPLIVTFVDPVCNGLCPLEVKVLDQAVERMPIARRPAIVAVSVDPSADARSKLLEDARALNLVSQWRWAVGPRARLASVWKRYKITVEVQRRKVAGKTIATVFHTVAVYIVDATGHERALFLWPFLPQKLERALRQIT